MVRVLTGILRPYLQGRHVIVLIPHRVLWAGERLAVGTPRFKQMGCRHSTPPAVHKLHRLAHCGEGQIHVRASEEQRTNHHERVHLIAESLIRLHDVHVDASRDRPLSLPLRSQHGGRKRGAHIHARMVSALKPRVPRTCRDHSGHSTSKIPCESRRRVTRPQGVSGPWLEGCPHSHGTTWEPGL